jgi:hypothetical protein
MAVTTTTRFGLYRWSSGADAFTRTHMDTSHSVIESKGAIYVQGVFSARPSAGVEGRFFFATDTSAMYYDTGSAWASVQTTASIASSLIDAKGDLIVGASDNTPAKLTVGTNGYVLTANSGATNGVEWAVAATPTEAISVFLLAGC